MNNQLSYSPLSNIITRVNDLLITLATSPGQQSQEYKMAKQILSWLEQAHRCTDEDTVYHLLESSILPKLSHLSINLYANQQRKTFAAKPKILAAVKHITSETNSMSDNTPALHKPLASPEYTREQRGKIDALLNDLKNLLDKP